MKLTNTVSSMLFTLLVTTACSSPTPQIASGGLNASSPQQRCDAMANLSSTRFEVDITESRYVGSVDALGQQKNWMSPAHIANFKPYCQLTGYFEKRTGADNKPYAIGFALALPDDWNGQFLFQGGGGLNGIITPPVGGLAAGDTPALYRGFAVASTDGGHQSDTVFDPSFFTDQRALLNFYSGAVEKSTHLALELLEQVYAQAPKQRYFVGCSTGGREAMTMSQRFPELFDGIIVAAPARQTNYSEIADLWSAKRLRQVNDDQQQAPFSAPQQQAIVKELLAQCDANDGLADGLIFDVSGCDFKPEKLLCENGSDSATCLDQARVTALQEAFAGPRSSDGRQVYPGFYYDTGISASGQRSVPGLLQAVPGPLGRQYMAEDFDINKQLELAQHFPLAGGNATLTSLSTFAHLGGKIMFFHGVSDPWFSAKDTLEYYQAMMAANGGEAATANWSQFYFVPGMGHCSGGEQTLDNFDMLSALNNWVVSGQRPESVVATGQSMPGVSRPLCPYPQMAVYDGQGNPQSAASFVCKTPE